MGIITAGAKQVLEMIERRNRSEVQLNILDMTLPQEGPEQCQGREGVRKEGGRKEGGKKGRKKERQLIDG